MKKSQDNFLEYIPEKNCQWESSGDGKISLVVPRFKNKFFKRISLKLGKSEFVKISFDIIGSATWKLVDGETNIEKIGRLLETELGEKVQPLYERLTEFFVILARNKFVILKKRNL